jgi:hypothetical protein
MGYDLLSYATRSEIFPHDSTGDQFFRDEMFTAYAALGRHTGRAARDAVVEAYVNLPERCTGCGSTTARDEVRAALLRLEAVTEDDVARQVAKQAAHEQAAPPQAGTPNVWDRILAAFW